MSLVVNTNIASLTAQLNLSRNQSSLQTTLQRLSSGLRVNSAKDDAAGLLWRKRSRPRSVAIRKRCAMPTTAFRWAKQRKAR